jgi:hypothetical protein
MPPPPPVMQPPPGYVPYGGQGAFSPFSRIRGLAKALVVVQIVGAAAAAVVLVMQLSLVGRAQDFLDGEVSASVFEDDLAPFLLFSVLSGLLALAGLVLLIVWSFRIAGNLQKMGRPITWKPGLTIVVWLLGGCTLNIVNFLMLREHWTGSDPETPPHAAGWKERPVSPLIVGWFVMGLGQIVIGFLSGLQSFAGVSAGNDTEAVAESLSDRLLFVLVSGALSVGATVVLVLIVRQLTARHTVATREA